MIITKNNGRIARIHLHSVAGTLLVLKPARDLARAVKAAKKHHPSITITAEQPAGGYRSIATQEGMRLHPGEYNVTASMQHSLAAPGHSTHGEGKAVDIAGTQALDWMVAHGAEYGWHRTDPHNDPRHFEHK